MVLVVLLIILNILQPIVLRARARALYFVRFWHTRGSVGSGGVSYRYRILGNIRQYTPIPFC